MEFHGIKLTDSLLRAHNENNLVFFCGAGVSYKLGFKDFKWLASEIEKSLCSSKESDIPEETSLDKYLNSLAVHYGDVAVKKSAIKRLALPRKCDLSTHKALLKLAVSSHDRIQLVTTNFDEGFVKAARKLNFSSKFDIDKAPKLPVLGKYGLNSIVHLHGVIDKKKDPKGCSLVLTSADFGRAYLNEGWAINFIREVFKKFTVVFVGYSLNDPIMSYFMDAIADSETDKKHCIFLPNDPSNKYFGNLEVITYSKDNNHAALHDMLQAWAEVYDMSLMGYKRLITPYLDSQTSPSSEAIRNVCYAIRRYEDGTIAKYFADYEPSPSISWLTIFEAQNLFEGEGKASIKLIGNTPCDSLPPIIEHLSKWILKNLDNAQTLQWALTRNHRWQFHPVFNKKIKNLLSKLPIQKNPILQVWNLLTNFTLFKSREYFTVDECLDYATQQINEPSFLEAITPYLCVYPHLGQTSNSEGSSCRNINEVATFAIELGTPFMPSFIEKLRERPHYEVLISKLSFEISLLLKRACELRQLFSENFDARPFITPHKKNQVYQQSPNNHWTYLIDLTIDAFEAKLKHSPLEAKVLIDFWKTISFRLFYRLTLYTMAKSTLYDNHEIKQYIFHHLSKFFLDDQIRAERMLLLRQKISLFSQEDIELIINQLNDVVESTEVDKKLEVERELWIFISSIELLKNDLLSVEAEKKLHQLQDRFGEPEEYEYETQQPNFESWMVGDKSNIDFSRDYSPEELVGLLTIQEPFLRQENLAAWSRFLPTQPEKGIALLEFSYKSKNWDKDLWHYSLFPLQRNTASIALIRIFTRLPKKLIQENLDTFCDWLSSVFNLEMNQDSFERLWDKLFKASMRGKQSIHASGRITKILLQRLFEIKPALDVIPDFFKTRFEKMIENREKSLAPMLVLFSYLYNLHSLDRAWTKNHLMSLLELQQESKDNIFVLKLWANYLRAPTFSNSKTFLRDIKRYLEDIVSKKSLFSASKDEILCRKSIVELYVLANLYYPNVIQLKYLLLNTLDLDELEHVSTVVWRFFFLSENKEKVWESKLKDWITQHWPQEIHLIKSKQITENFCAILIALEDSFCDAFSVLKKFFVPLDAELYNLIDQIQTSNHPKQYPNEVLELLSLIVDVNTAKPKGWREENSNQIKNILQDISGVNSKLAEEKTYKKLWEWIEKIS